MTTAAPTTTTAPTTTGAPTTTEAPVTTAPRDCSGVSPGDKEFTLTAGGAKHSVSVYLPSSYDPDVSLPVVLDFHGLGASATEQVLLSNYLVLAEIDRIIVVNPTGVPNPGDSRNAWELAQFDVPGRDDVVFVDALIDEVLENYCADPSRVYAIGMSNGGLFTSRLVCELGDRIAAAASVAGVTHPDGCEPSRAVPFIAFHGTADEVVPYDGTVSGSSLEGDAVPAGSDFFEQVMPDEFAEFAADMGCDPEAPTTGLGDDVVVHDYEGCDDGADLVFYEIVDGGHTWPGSPIGLLLEGVLGHTTSTISATLVSWEFFQQYTL